ncbi:efflux RND transporter periplasmic adaptor subunit [Roseovarius sp. D0-M9]|uniref:efflux RND transporter periplasmic adaptor subunit n=1 Tax=Roseovarius sp. D0-M9 TaxID=3127117 RepID=UPI00300FB06A
MRNGIKFILGLCIIGALGVAGVFGTGALLSMRAPDGGEDDQRPATPVDVAQPVVRDIEDAVTAVGTLRPVRSVELVPDAPGRVTEVPVTSGQHVEEGALLIQLDDRAARAALSEAEATLAEARQERDRVEELANSNVAAGARLEGARATFLRAEAAAMDARADLQDRAIMAPFAGTLGVFDIEPGTYLDGSAPVTRLSDLTSVEVAISLPERYFERVAPGQTLIVTTPAYPGETFEGEVTIRASEVDLGSRSFALRAEIANPEGRLVGGMFANSRLIFGVSEGLAIPDDAIISEGLTTYVYRVEDGAAARTEIEVGRSLGPLTEVREGLSAEDRVVVAGWDQLSDGAPVEVAETIDGVGESGDGQDASEGAATEATQ